MTIGYCESREFKLTSFEYNKYLNILEKISCHRGLVISSNIHAAIIDHFYSLIFLNIVENSYFKIFYIFITTQT